MSTEYHQRLLDHFAHEVEGESLRNPVSVH